MYYTLYRLTPTRSLTLNNRWYEDVNPKYHFFFIKRDDIDLNYWIKFFCEAHHKTYLFCHTVVVNALKVKYRTLFNAKAKKVEEVMIPVKNCKILSHNKRRKVSYSSAVYFIQRLEGKSKL